MSISHLCDRGFAVACLDSTERTVVVNLHHMLLARKAAGKPVTIGLIGAGKFGTMFLSQVRVTDGMHMVAIADLNVKRAHAHLGSGPIKGIPNGRMI